MEKDEEALDSNNLPSDDFFDEVENNPEESEVKAESEPNPLSEENLLGENAMYVTDPTLNKEGLTTYVSYTVQGSKVPDSIVRRFKDFYNLRVKLLERWPGIYIPRTPHRKNFGNKTKEVVDKRIEIINSFCLKISKIPYLFDSEEMKLFLSNDPNSIKTLENLPKPQYDELLYKYKEAFNVDDDDSVKKEFEETVNNFDTIKSEQNAFYSKLKESFPIVQAFLEKINKLKEQFIQDRINLLNSFDLISSYEKDWLCKFANNNQLIVNNISNRNMGTSLSKFEIFAKGEVTSPFDNFYNKIQIHLFDIEANIEAYDSFLKLCEEKEKLSEKLTQYNDLVGKKGGPKYEKLKEDTEKNLSDITEIIHLCLFNIKKQYKNFKTEYICNYYKSLKIMIKDMKKDSSYADNLYMNILSDHLIKEVP